MRYFCDRLTTWLDGFVEGMGGGYVECGHLGGHAPLLVASRPSMTPIFPTRIPWPCWQLQRAFLHETGQTMTHDEKTLN
ncbi:hypothetical protein DBR19_06220 [Aeromonas sp. HMWF014]|nr:hypothetical protein DBR19_06220 [Aeromonas sp. HMWF014]